MVLGCSKEDCAGLDWTVAEGQLQFAVASWLTLSLLGVSIWLLSSLSSSWEETKVRVTAKWVRLRSSYVYSTLNLLFRFLQCVSYVTRASSKSAPAAFVIIELVACAVLLLELLPTLAVHFFTGIMDGLKFSLTALLADSLVISSVVSMTFMEVHGNVTWFSLSFVSASRLAEYWHRCLENRGEDIPEQLELQVEIINVSVYTLSMTFFAAMSMMALENLDDPDWLEDYSRDKWSTVSSVYYVLVTISTVGYGDLTPRTGLGRSFAVLVIFGGISSFFVAVAKVLRIMSQRQTGRGAFHPGTRIRHIIVTGCPRIQMTKDFILELFHPDHAEEADDLHVVFLLQPGSSTMEGIGHFCRQRENIAIANRVHVLAGSALNTNDLLRASLGASKACFVLPDLHCGDPAREDADNIIRMMAMLRYAPHARMVLLLMKDEHQQLLYEAMGQDALAHSDVTCLTMDQFKLNMAGKSALVPGFATLICNLCKTIDPAEYTENDQDLLAWQRNYLRGLGNELYEIPLSNTYALREALFCEVVIDVLQQTEGSVYLIGLVEVSRDGNRVIVNPGPTYKVKQADSGSGVTTRGIFIAPEREAITQCEGGQVFLGRKDSEERKAKMQNEAIQDQQQSVGQTFPSATVGHIDREFHALRQARKEREEREQPHTIVEDPDEIKLALRQQGVHHQHQERAKEIVRMARIYAKSTHPPRPPLKVLAKGGHVVFLCVGQAGTDDLRLGLQHFVRPLRAAHLQHAVPVVVLGRSTPKDWNEVVQFKDVYFLHGSPGSLFDLERVAFRSASVIFVCDVGSNTHAHMNDEPWMADSQVIFCARLVESQLPHDTETRVIVSLDVDTNHGFIPLPGVSASGRPIAPESRAGHSTRMMPSALNLPGEEALGVPQRHTSLASVSSRSSWWLRWFSGTKGVQEEDDEAPSIKEYYRQPRFACGQLIISSVATSLVANLFYNPSLSHLVTSMVESSVVMEIVPPEWAGKSYFEFFDHLLWNKALLPIAIYRVVVSRGKLEKQTTAHALVGLGHEDVEANRGSRRSYRPRNRKKEEEGRKWSYLWIAPQAKEATMLAGDRVICFGVSGAVTKNTHSRSGHGAHRHGGLQHRSAPGDHPSMPVV